jgi:1,4-alpha-glucan branching enzyme
MQHFVRTLNRLYREYDALYYNDHDPLGFEWMGCDDDERSIISFVRRGSTKERQLLFVCNFTPVVREHYRCGVPCLGKYKEVLNSDRSEFGGHNIINTEPLEAEDIPSEKGSASIEFTLPGLSVVIFEYDSSRQSVEKAEKRLKKRRMEKEKNEKELINSKKNEKEEEC